MLAPLPTHGRSLPLQEFSPVRDFPYHKLDREEYKVAVRRSFSELTYKGYITEHVLVECKVDSQMHPFASLICLWYETEIANTGWIIWVTLFLFKRRKVFVLFLFKRSRGEHVKLELPEFRQCFFFLPFLPYKAQGWCHSSSVLFMLLRPFSALGLVAAGNPFISWVNHGGWRWWLLQDSRLNKHEKQSFLSLFPPHRITFSSPFHRLQSTDQILKWSSLPSALMFIFLDLQQHGQSLCCK